MKTIKRTILLSLAITLIFASLSVSLPAGTAGQSANDISILFAKVHSYIASGTSFNDSEVSGTASWSSNFANTIDTTNEAVKGLSVTLDSNTVFTRINPVPDSYGPPTYHWSFGNVPQNKLPDWSPQVVIGFTAQSNLTTFKPGFDVSWSADKRIFTSTDTQTITLTLNPRETQNYNIVLDASKSPLVKAKINPPQPVETGNIELTNDGQRITIYKHQHPAGAVLTYKFTIQVTPTIPNVEFLPDISISSSQDLSGKNVTGSSFITTVPDVGTWTWTAYGEHNCSLHEIYSRVVIFPGYPRANSLTPVSVNFATILGYEAQSGNFTNQMVKGYRNFTSQFINDDNTGLSVPQTVLTLDTQKKYNVTDGYLSQGNRRILPDVTGPPTYRWSFGDIADSFTARGIAGIPEDVADFTPGFDISRVVDSTDFNESGIQTLTVTATAREAIPAIRIYVNLVEDSYVNPTIDTPLVNPQEYLYISPDRHNLSKMITNPIVGISYTLEIKINVELKPDVTRCSFLPMTSADTYLITQKGREVNVPSIAHEMSGVGTWAWSTSGTYIWHWEEWSVKNIMFQAYSKGSKEEFTGSVPLPHEVSTKPEVIGTNILLTSILVILFYLAVTLFNSTFKENYATIQSWASRLRGFLNFRKNRKRKKTSNTRSFPQWLEMTIIILISAIINSIVSPSFGFSEKGLVMFIAMIVTVVASTYSYNGIRVLVMKHNYHIPATIKAYPLAIILAIIFVVISRIISFHPGFIFGFVGAFTILPSAFNPDKKQRSIGILWGTLVVVILAASAFMLREPLSSLPDNNWSLVPDTVLVALFVGGLERLLFGLIPITFLDGGTLASWKKWVWLIVFGIIVFLFIHMVINKTDTLTHAVKDMNVINMFGLVLISLVLSVIFWSYFYIRAIRTRRN